MRALYVVQPIDVDGRDQLTTPERNTANGAGVRARGHVFGDPGVASEGGSRGRLDGDGIDSRSPTPVWHACFSYPLPLWHI